MLLTLIVCAGIAMALDIRRRVRIINPAEICIWFIVASQIIYLNGDTFFWTRVYRSSYSYETHPLRGVLVYGVIAAVLYSSTLFVRRISPVDLRTQLNRIAQTFLVWQIPCLALILFVVLIHFLLLDKQVLWHNRQYLLLRSPEAMAGGGIGALLQNVLKLGGSASALFVAANLQRRQALFAFLWLLPFSWITLLQAADCSRLAALLVMELYFLTFFLVGLKGRVLASVVLLPLSLLLFASALAGRGAQDFGIAAIPDILRGAFAGDIPWTDFVENVFEGVFTTSDGLDMPAAFPDRYKWLSFSPLPSLIDHFDAIRQADEVRLSRYAPMSAITEAVKFGPGFAVALLVSWWIMFRIVLTSSRHVGPAYPIVCFGLVASFVESGAYGLRNVYRLSLLWTLLALILMWRARGRGATRRPRPRHLVEA